MSILEVSSVGPAPGSGDHTEAVIGPALGMPAPSTLEVGRARFDAPLERLAAGDLESVALWAAAGAGKSTVIVRWARALAERGETVLWARGAAALDALDTARGVEGPVYVFVDDAHLIASAQAKAALSHALEDASGRVRVVVAGRHQPIAGLAHLQAADRMLELRTADLAFDVADVASLAARHDVHLTEAAAAALVDRTGGWATAIALAMPWLARSTDTTAAVDDFSGDNSAVADFLIAEVLDGLPERSRRVLTDAAVSAYVPTDLAILLSAREDAGGVLHEIAASNALLEEDSHGYRFHPVLLAFLGAEARRLSPDAAAAKHTVAADWFAAHERPSETLKQAMSATEGVLERTLRDVGLELTLTGRTQRIASALARFPVDESTPLCALVLRLLIDAPTFADHRRARQLLALADRVVAVTPERADTWTVALDAVRCFIEVRDRRSFAGAVNLSDVDAMNRRESDLGLDLLCATAEGWLFGKIGETGRAQTVLRDVRVAAHRAGLDWLLLVAGELEISVLGDLGRWDEAVVIEDGLVEVASRFSRPPGDRMRRRVEVVAATRAYLTCGETDADSLSRLVAADSLGLDPELSVAGRMLEVLPSLDSDQNPRRALDEAERLMREAGVYVPRTLALAAPRLIALRGVLDGRTRARETAELVIGILGPDSVEGAIARFVLSAPARSTEPCVRQLLRAASGGHAWHPASFVSAWLVLARFAHDSGRLADADASTLRALELAERYRLIRPFLSPAEDGVGLVTERLGRLGHLEHLARHIIDSAPRRSGLTIATQPIDSLTPKEREILLELPVHQSVAEIAARHSLSVNTVKTHLRNIYQKLGVTDRSEAVTAAQRVGLI